MVKWSLPEEIVVFNLDRNHTETGSMCLIVLVIVVFLWGGRSLVSDGEKSLDKRDEDCL
jgi:hypothetical protein